MKIEVVVVVTSSEPRLFNTTSSLYGIDSRLDGIGIQPVPNLSSFAGVASRSSELSLCWTFDSSVFSFELGLGLGLGLGYSYRVRVRVRVRICE